MRLSKFIDKEKMEIKSKRRSVKFKRNKKQLYRIYFNQKNSMLINLFLIIFILLISLFSIVNSTLLQGCNFDNSLCEQTEICLADGLFGQCYSEMESEILKPLIIEKELDPFQQELFQLELKRLANNGLNWPDAQAQCTFAYFKLTVVYDLDYDPKFCSVRNPNNIWALIQKVQNILTSENNEDERESSIRDLFLRNGIVNDNEETFKLKPKILQQKTLDNNEIGLAVEPVNLIVQQQQQPQLIQQQEYNQNKIVPVLLVDENQPLLSSDENELTEQPVNKNLIVADDSPATEQVNQSLLKAILKQSEAVKRSIVNNQGDVDFEIPNNSYEPLVIPNKYNFEDYNQQLAWNAWLKQLIPQLSDTSLPELNSNEEKQLDDYVIDTLNNKHPNLKDLNNNQLDKLVGLINSLKLILQKRAIELEKEEVASAPELEEIIPLTSQKNEQQLLLKKDSEKFNNADMGLSNTVHKIVKGGIQRVEGNRVYLKVALSNEKKLTEKELYRLVNYLDEKIAQPNNLFFDKFAYDNGQISFRVAQIKFAPNLQKLFDELNAQIEPNELTDIENNNNNNNNANEKINDNSKKGIETQLKSVSGVARAVYKRRRDIHTLSGIEVDETGIGSGVDVVPVESSHNNYFKTPLIAVCGLVIALVCTVLAVQLLRTKGFYSIFLNKKLKDKSLLKVIDNLEGKLSTIYEDLCRQRMNAQDLPISVNVIVPTACPTSSKHSSVSSWPDENVLQSSNLDISTGHVILGFLKDCLEKPDEITNQWKQLSGYENIKKQTTIATESYNLNKNYDNTILPYDDSLVTVEEIQQTSPKKLLNDDNNTLLVELDSINNKSDEMATKSNNTKYINASKIFDADPRQILYIAAQTPLQQTSANFWQMIWQENIVLIVNLCDQAKDQQSKNFIKYWPEEGSKVFGIFEVYLVSEHIWSEDYVVRSLYLKNLSTNETRTVTQFHYLTWPEDGLPKAIKSLLEFRKKVNKSYRGHSSPVLVHCTNGSGRTGTYCLIDMVINRILKGVKELNIAGSLEHLRDQRMKMVENEEQYKLVFQCVAEEVSLLLKNLQN